MGRKKSSKKGKKTGASNKMWFDASTDTSPVFRKGMVTAALGRALNPFPPVWRTTMTTRLVGQFSSGAAATGKFVVKGNSVFQPWNVTSAFPNPVVGATATENPAGFTGLLSANGPYLAFRVIGSAVRAEVIPTTGGDTIDFSVSPTLGTSPTANYQDAIQQKYASTRLVSYANSARPLLQSSLASSEAVGEKSTVIVDDDDYLGTYAADPTKLWSWQVWYATCDGAVLGAALPVVCCVSYDVLVIHMNLDGSSESVSMKCDTASRSASGEGDDDGKESLLRVREAYVKSSSSSSSAVKAKVSFAK